MGEAQPQGARGHRGQLLDFEVRPKTFEGKPVLFSKTGVQREDWVITFRVDEAQRADADDDGLRKMSLNESAQRALTVAIKESKVKAEAGGRIKAAVTEDPATDREQATYKFKYEAAGPEAHRGRRRHLRRRCSGARRALLGGEDLRHASPGRAGSPTDISPLGVGGAGATP